MKLRFSIRSGLLGTAFFATACGWYANNAAMRRDEVTQLIQLQRVIENDFAITESGHPYDGCGTWSGAIVYIDHCGPAFLRPLGLSAFKRVVEIEVQDESKVAVISAISNFRTLQRLTCGDSGFVSDDVALRQYVQAIRHFQMNSPNVAVHFWGFDRFSEVLAVKH